MTTIKKIINDKYGRKKQFKPNITISIESKQMKKEIISSINKYTGSPNIFPTETDGNTNSFHDVSLNSTNQNHDFTIDQSNIAGSMKETIITTDPNDTVNMDNTLDFNQSSDDTIKNTSDFDITGNMNKNESSINVAPNVGNDNQSTHHSEPKKASIFNKIIDSFSAFISKIVSLFKSFVGFIMSPFTKQPDTKESTPEISAQQLVLDTEEVNIPEDIQQQQQNDLTHDVIVGNGAQEWHESTVTQEGVSDQIRVNTYIAEQSRTMLNSTWETSSSLNEIGSNNDNNNSNDFSLEYNSYESPFLKHN